MTAEQMRAQIVSDCKRRLKKNAYTTASKRKYFYGYPTPNIDLSLSGYSDCSEMVRRLIQRAAGIDIGSNTNAQIKNRAKGKIVDQTDGYYPDEGKLKIGDCLYFKGNTSHTLDVGHVEIYTGPNECHGHGSGTGPTKKKLKDYCKSRASSSRRYFMAIRWLPDDGAGEDDAFGDTLGSRLLVRGSKGEDVRELQTILRDLGYDLGAYGPAKDGVDGEYGVKTVEAIKVFQIESGLVADGEYGPLTHAALMAAVDTQETPDTEDSEQIEGPSVEITGGTVNVRKGPATSFGIITRAKKGEKYVHVATAYNGWLCIIVGDTTAWVSNKYAYVG